jgi:hypothetical protein
MDSNQGEVVLKYSPSEKKMKRKIDLPLRQKGNNGKAGRG